MSQIYKDAPQPPSALGRYKILSSTSGLRASPLALGSLTLGDAWNDVMGCMDKSTAVNILDAYFEAGGNLIDTAPNYQDGQSEQWIGEWMTKRDIRDRVLLCTKYSHDYMSQSLGKGKSPNTCGNHRRSLHLSIDRSLKNLQTTWVDILCVHFWDWTTSVEEVMNSLHMLVESGKVMYLGVSDTPAWVVSAANTYATIHGKTPFSVYQGRWNVLYRDLEREIIPMAHHFRMAILAWDVLGGGHFKTQREIEERASQGSQLRSIMSKSTQTEQEKLISEALTKVAAEHNVDSITSIALAYIRAKATNVFPLVGVRSVAHLQAAIHALQITLTDEQVKYLESAVPFDLGFPLNVIGENPYLTGVAQPLLRATAAYDFGK